MSLYEVSFYNAISKMLHSVIEVEAEDGTQALATARQRFSAEHGYSVSAFDTAVNVVSSEVSPEPAAEVISESDNG